MTSTPTRSCCRSGKAFRSGLLFCVPTLSLLPSPLSPTSLSPSCKPAAKILLKFILLAASISMETSRNHGNHLNWAKRFQNCCTRLLIFPPLNLFLCTSVYLHIMNTFTVRVCLLHLFFFFFARLSTPYCTCLSFDGLWLRDCVSHVCMFVSPSLWTFWEKLPNAKASPPLRLTFSLFSLVSNLWNSKLLLRGYDWFDCRIDWSPFAATYSCLMW